MSVKILYLYSDFMNLYGDNGNVRILEKRLKDQGLDVEIINRTITDFEINFIVGTVPHEMILSELQGVYKPI